MPRKKEITKEELIKAIKKADYNFANTAKLIGYTKYGLQKALNKNGINISKSFRLIILK